MRGWGERQRREDRRLNVSEVVTADQQDDEVEKIIDVKTFGRAVALTAMASVRVETAIEVNLPDVRATHGFRDIVLEQTAIGLENFGRFFVERIFRVRFLKRKFSELN